VLKKISAIGCLRTCENCLHLNLGRNGTHLPKTTWYPYRHLERGILLSSPTLFAWSRQLVDYWLKGCLRGLLSFYHSWNDLNSTIHYECQNQKLEVKQLLLHLYYCAMNYIASWKRELCCWLYLGGTIQIGLPTNMSEASF
jgi:hypothetical protein